MAAANVPSPAPEMETLEVASRRPATHQHNAITGRLVFHTRYSILGDQSRTQELYDGLKTANALKDPMLQDYAAEFAAWLQVTSRVDFWHWDDHPELVQFRDFWRWWVEESAKPTIDYTALWNWRMEMGWSVTSAWKKAYDGGHAVSLRAPRVLLPDEQLTAEERADPNSAPGAKNAGPSSASAGDESPKASAATASG